MIVGLCTLTQEEQIEELGARLMAQLEYREFDKARPDRSRSRQLYVMWLERQETDIVVEDPVWGSSVLRGKEHYRKLARDILAVPGIGFYETVHREGEISHAEVTRYLTNRHGMPPITLREAVRKEIQALLKNG